MKIKKGCRLCNIKGHSLLFRHRQNWVRGFILLLPQAALLPGSDAGSDGVEQASGFVNKNRFASQYCLGILKKYLTLIIKPCCHFNMCLCINGGNDDETVKMEDAKVPRVKEFKYLRSTVQESGGCEREVKKRVQAGWNGWRRVSGVICDRRLPARVKGKVYSSVVRPAMVYGLETVAVTKKQVEEMEVAEMKMLRFAMGVTRKDKIRNDHIRSTVKIERLGMKMRGGRLRWYGHVMRRDQEYVGRKMMEMELLGKRRRGRPKRRFVDVVKKDMGEVGAKETDVEDRKV